MKRKMEGSEMSAGIILIAIFSSLIASIASYFLKKTTGKASTIPEMLKTWTLYVGGVLYLISACIGIYILKKIDYSVAVPLGALTYVWTLVVSRVLLKEKITLRKVLGIGIILLGVIIMAKSV